MGKILLDKFGVTEKTDSKAVKKINILPYFSKEADFNHFKSELDRLEKSPVQVDLFLKTHGLEQVEGLNDYILNKDIENDHVYELIQTQYYKNTASQAHGYSGVQKAIETYNKSLSVNSDKTTAATDSTKKFIDILSTNNAKLADCMRNANGCSIKISDYAVSLGKSAIKTVALTAATAALNAAMSFGISVIISGLTTAIDNFIHRAERLTEAAKNASENITNIKSSFDNLKNSTGDITQEFAELSQHVDQITGKNIDLSPKDYERFLELSNQLAESLPNAGYSIDENGNKIIGLTGTIDEITQSINNLVDAERLLAHQEIDQNMDDVFDKALEDLRTYHGELENLKANSSEFMTDTKEMVRKLLNGERLDFDLSNETNSQVFSDLRKLFDGAGLKLGIEPGGKIVLAHNAEWAELSADEINQLEAGADAITDKYSEVAEGLSEKMADTQNNIQNTQNTLSSHLNSWVTTGSDYKSIVQTYGSDLGIAIQQAIRSSVDWTKVETIDNWDDLKRQIETNILDPLKDVKNEDIRKAYTELFTNANIPIDSAISYLEQIEQYFKDNNLEIPVIFTKRKEEIEEVKDKFDKRNSSFTSGNVEGLNEFFTENNIDGESKYEKWLTVTEGITDATEAMRAWNIAQKEAELPTSPKSFEEAWKSLDYVDSDSEQSGLKEKLLELANQGKLTASEFNKTAGAKSWLKEIGITAEEAVGKINKLKSVSSTAQLTSMKTGISSISSILGEKNNNLSDKRTANNGIDIEMLGSMPEDVKSCRKEYEDFCTVLGDGSSTMAECKAAANKLAAAYINNGNYLAKLTRKNKDYYISALKEMGIENADAIIKNILTQKQMELNAEKQWANATTISLTDATYDEITSLAAEQEWSEETTNALYRLALQKQTINGVNLSTAADIDSLSAMIDAIGGTTTALNIYKEMLKHGDRYTTVEMADAFRNAQAEVEAAKKKAENAPKKIPKITTNPTLSSPGSSSLNKNKEKEATQVIDWLERRFTRMQNIIDLTASKLQNLFSIKKKDNNLDKQIKQTTKLINQYSVAINRYKSKAKAAAKGLPKDIKKKVVSGEVTKANYSNLVKTYKQEKADKIQNYIDWYDKWQSAKQSRQEQITKKRELKEQRNQLYIDQADSKLSAIDAQLEVAKNSNGEKSAKAMNKVLQKKVEWTKQYYKYQIKNAKLEEDGTKVAELRAQKEKALLDIKIQKRQNLADKREAHYNLNQQRAENATDAKTKNKYEAKSLKNKQDQYKYLKEIAELEYGEKSAEYKLLQEEEKAVVNESYKKMYDNIKAEYDNKTGLNDTRISTIQSEIATLEAAGQPASKSLYDGMMKINEGTKEKLLKKREELMEAGKDFEYASPEWYAWQDDMESIDQSLYSCTQQAIEFQKAVNELDFKKFSLIASQLDATKSHLDFLVDMLSHDDLTSKDAGGLTDAGFATISLRFANMENNAKIRENAQAELAKLHEDHINGKDYRTEEEYLAYEKELEDTIRDTLEADADEKDAILDLVENAMQVQIDAIDELIEKKKKALATEKDLYEYQKKVAQQTKNIALIEKQIAALSGDHSEEARAKLQKLQVSLEEAQEELRDTEYDKWYDDQTDMLDNLADEVEDFWERIMNDLRKDINGSMDSLLQMVTDNPEAVARALDELGLGNALSIITTYNPDGTHTNSSIDYGGNSYESTYDKTGTNVNNKFDTSIDGVTSAADDLSYEAKRVTGTTSDLNKVLQDAEESFNESVEKSKDSLAQTVLNHTSSKHNVPDTTDNNTTTATAGKGTLEDNNRVGKNAEIDSFLKKNLRKPKNTEESMRIATDKLLQYLDKKYNKKGYLTKAKEAELAEMLGISLKDKKNITYDESIKLRNALKNAGFSQGGVASTLNQAAKANGDDGLITLKRGEAVLTEEQTNAVQKLADLVPVERKITEEQERILMEHLGIPLDYSNMMPAYRNIPVNNTTNASVSVGDVNIHMDGSNVTDPDSFCNTLNHSLNMQGAIKRCVAADMAKSYSNKLGKF